MLISRGLMEESIISNRAAAWREEGDAPIGLIITPAGHHALSLDESSIDTAISSGCERPAPRSGSKQAVLIDLIGRDNGATIDELILATGWLPHTTRAVISGLRKRGIPVISAREGGVSRYRVLGVAK